MAVSTFPAMGKVTLADRARLARVRAGFENEAAAARAIGCSRPLVIAWENGDAKSIGSKYLIAAAKAYRVRPAWLGDGQEPDGFPWSDQIPEQDQDDPDWSDIIGVRQAAALGDGAVADEYAETHKLKFRADSLRRKHLRPDKLAVIYGKGDSMFPTIKDGDAILVDTSDRTPRDGKLYVITYNGDLMAKRLVELGGRWFIESDNRTDPKWHKPQPLDGTKGIEIHGRVRWIGSWED